VPVEGKPTFWMCMCTGMPCPDFLLISINAYMIKHKCIYDICFAPFVSVGKRWYELSWDELLQTAHSVWLIQCLFNSVCGKFSVCSIQCLVNLVCGQSSVCSIQCVVNPVCGQSSVRSIQWVVNIVGGQISGWAAALCSSWAADWAANRGFVASKMVVRY
jgi:hypothetical protein